MPSHLAKIVSSRTEGRYPVDGEFYLAELPWNLPESISPGLIQDARSALPAAEADCRPADKAQVGKWLNALGMLCAGSMTAQEAAAKLNAYSTMLEVPASVLTRTNLDEAAKKFTWFPSYAEVAQFLEARSSVKRKIRDRLERIATSTPSQQEPANVPWSQRTEDQKARLDSILAETYARLKA